MSSLDDNDENKTNPVKQQSKLEKWQLALIIIGVVILVLFIFVRVNVWMSENNPKQNYRDFWTHALNHHVDLIPSFLWNRKKFKIQDMDDGAWNLISVPSEFLAPQKDTSIVPVIIHRQPKPNLSAVNWLRLEKLSSPPRTVVYFHGSGLSNEYHYKDFKSVCLAINANIILIEYPGYGPRKKQGKSTEADMMDRYPKEVDYILNHVLKVDWKDTIVWASCMGTVIGLRTLWYIWKQQQLKTGKIDFPAAIYLTKPFASYKHFTTMFFSGRFSLLSRMAPVDLLNILYEKPGWNHELFSMCKSPVLITTGENDWISSEKLSRMLLEKFLNSQWRRFTMIKNAGHTIRIIDIVSSEISRTI